MTHGNNCAIVNKLSPAGERSVTYRTVVSMRVIPVRSLMVAVPMVFSVAIGAAAAMTSSMEE